MVLLSLTAKWGLGQWKKIATDEVDSELSRPPASYLRAPPKQVTFLSLQKPFHF